MKAHSTEVDDVLAGGVAVEDLEEEEHDGGDGVEFAMAPPMARLLTGGSDRFGAEDLGEVLAQPVEDRQDACGHGRAPFCSWVCRFQPPG